MLNKGSSPLWDLSKWDEVNGPGSHLRETCGLHHKEGGSLPQRRVIRPTCMKQPIGKSGHEVYPSGMCRDCSSHATDKRRHGEIECLVHSRRAGKWDCWNLNLPFWLQSPCSCHFTLLPTPRCVLGECEKSPGSRREWEEGRIWSQAARVRLRYGGDCGKITPLPHLQSGTSLQHLHLRVPVWFYQWLQGACNVPGMVLRAGGEASSKRHELVTKQVPALLSNLY